MADRSAALERRLDPILIAAALLTVPVIVIDGTDCGEPWKSFGDVLNWATWLVFVAEIVLMLSVVPDRRGWLARDPGAPAGGGVACHGSRSLCRWRCGRRRSYPRSPRSGCCGCCDCFGCCASRRLFGAPC